jgi:hypothetical protein
LLVGDCEEEGLVALGGLGLEELGDQGVCGDSVVGALAEQEDQVVVVVEEGRGEG